MSDLEVAIRASFPLKRTVELPDGSQIELQQPPYFEVRDLFLTLEEQYPAAYETPADDAPSKSKMAHKRALNEMNRAASIGMARLCLQEQDQAVPDDQLYILGDQCEPFAVAVIELCGRKRSKEADSGGQETEGVDSAAPFVSDAPTE